MLLLLLGVQCLIACLLLLIRRFDVNIWINVIKIFLADLNLNKSVPFLQKVFIKKNHCYLGVYF